MNFGGKLKSLRKTKGFSILQLAKKLGVDKSYISQLEHSKGKPSEKFIKKISKIFSINQTELSILAGKIPKEIQNMLHENPAIAPFVLKEEVEIYKRKPPSSPPKKLTPIFQTSLGELYNTDCLSLLSSLPENSVDCIFADPPFNLGKNYGSKVNDQLEKYDYLGWCYGWLEECCRILKPNGSLFVYNLPKWNIHISSYLDKFLTFRHWITVDIKFSLPVPKRLYPSHYSLLYFIKGRLPKTFHPSRLPMETCRHCGGEIKDYGGYKDKMNPKGVNLTDVWNDIPPVRHAKFKTRGANELSIKLLDRVLDIATEEGDLVMDPFGGSGTTYIVAEMKGRRWIGSEIESCKPIIERFKKIREQQEHLEKIRKNLNRLFTEEALKLRKRSGHSTYKYRLTEDEPKRVPNQINFLDQIFK
ncbi:MAG TPA: DNA methyltransferase [Nitrospiria bacterium]